MCVVKNTAYLCVEGRSCYGFRMKENEELTMPGYSRRAAISGALAAAGGAAVFGNSVSGASQKKKDELWVFSRRTFATCKKYSRRSIIL